MPPSRSTAPRCPIEVAPVWRVKIKSRSSQVLSNNACRGLISAASHESPTQVLIGEHAEQVRGKAGKWLSTVRVAVTKSHKPRSEPEGFFSTFVQLASD